MSGQNAYISGNITASLRNTATNVVAKNLADEFAGSGVGVNVVNPGTVTDEPSSEVQRAEPAASRARSRSPTSSRSCRRRSRR